MKNIAYIIQVAGLMVLALVIGSGCIHRSTADLTGEVEAAAPLDARDAEDNETLESKEETDAPEEAKSLAAETAAPEEMKPAASEQPPPPPPQRPLL